MVTVNNKLIKNFFNKEELTVLQKYCYNKLDFNKDYVLDGQSFSPAWYHDALMNSVLDTKLSKVEQECNLKLFPTYSYWRYYVYGGTLSTHTDRPACPGTYKGEGIAQVFFHYVNQNGPNKDHAYDQINKNL